MSGTNPLVVIQDKPIIYLRDVPLGKCKSSKDNSALYTSSDSSHAVCNDYGATDLSEAGTLAIFTFPTISNRHQVRLR